MRAKLCLVALLAALTLISTTSPALAGYSTHEELVAKFKQISQDNKSVANLQTLTKTPGKREMVLLKLSTDDNNPVIFVAANMEGDAPLASQAALQLAEKLTTEWKDKLDQYTWYILPVGNPDGYQRFFQSPVTESFVNDRLINDDKDDATNEDGPDDLNQDGLITIMRQLHPEGTYISVESNPLLMKKADTKKGEKGLYRIFPEGLDNDGDGEINEDGSGGTIPGRNFPHRFEHYTPANGTWAASEIESRAVLDFFYDHPEIAMAITFGHSNSLSEPPPSNQRGEAGGGPYKLPRWWANQVGVDKDKKFPISEIVEMAKDFFGDPNIDEDRVLRFLDGGAAVNPHKSDLPYLEKISEDFNDFLKENDLEAKRLESASFSPGCFEEWAYYQFGIPSFSYDFWTLPKVEKKEDESDSSLTPDQIKEMSSEDFLALGKEKIAKFLEDNKAPRQFSAEMLMERIKSEKMTTERLAKMLEQFGGKDDDDEAGDEREIALFAYNAESFVAWTRYNHPTLGEVEIGGAKPWATLAPDFDEGVELVNKQLPFIKDLPDLLPVLKIKETKVTKEADGVFKLEIWSANEGFLPYPTNHGKRTMRPAPAVVEIKGKVTFLDGHARKPISLLDGYGVTKSIWLISASEGQKLTITLGAPSAGSDSVEILLKGGQN